MSISYEDVQAEFLANADYFAEESVPKCKAFVTAGLRLLVLLPTVSKMGNAGETQWSVEAVEKQLADAKRWLAARTSRGATRFSSFEDFRR
jgi:hypothetical protein